MQQIAPGTPPAALVLLRCSQLVDPDRAHRPAGGGDDGKDKMPLFTTSGS